MNFPHSILYPCKRQAVWYGEEKQFVMDKNEILNAFWLLYEEYIQTGERGLRPKLSELLKEVENKDRKTQLLRPEKGWDTILGWQVLRNQQFVFTNTNLFDLCEGEILAWTPHWDRDVFLTRLPHKEVIAGTIIKPGFKLDYHEDRKGENDHEWDQMVRRVGITDEQGLYLPIYDLVTLIKFCDLEIAKIRPFIMDYLQKEKGFSLTVLNKLT